MKKHIKRIARLSAIASYSFSKMSPLASGVTVTTVVAMYTGVPWLLALFFLIISFGMVMAFVHFSGLYKEEQAYAIGEMGVGVKR